MPNGGTQQYIVFNVVILENVGNQTENITSDILFDGVGQGLTSPLDIYLPDAKTSSSHNQSSLVLVSVCQMRS